MDIIKKAITFPFQDKNWFKKYGITVLIFIGVMVIDIGLNLVFTLPILLMSGTYESGYQSSISDMAAAMTNLVSGTVSLLLLPISIYLFGYFIELARNVIKKEEHPMPEHTNLLQKLLKGGLGYAIAFIINIPWTVVFFVVTLIFVMLFGLPASFLSDSPILWILMALLGILAFVVFVALTIFAVLTYLASMYLYVTTDDFGKSLNPGSIIRLIKKYWKDFLKVVGYQLFLSVISCLAFIASAFTLFLAVPVVTMSLYYATAYIIGDVFREISEKEKN